MKKVNPIKMVITLFVLVIFIGNNNFVTGKSKDNLFRVSAGYGVPYGYMGINFEVNPLLPKNLHYLNNYFSFSLGVGYKEKRLLFALGVNGYPLGRKGFIQPRLSFYYAKIDRILDIYNTYEKDYDTIDAICLGGGIVLQLSEQLSLTGDAFYLAHVYNDLYSNHSRFKFAVGGQFDFKTPYSEQVGKTSFLSTGIGIGIPYGAIGVNIEMNPLLPGSLGKTLHNYFSISIGSGVTNAGNTYSFGARIYPLGKSGKYLPRIGIYEGTVAMYIGRSNFFNLEGVAISAGILYKINNRISFDCDLVYIADIFGWSRINTSRLKISCGIRYTLNNKKKGE